MDDVTRLVGERLAARTDWERDRKPGTRFSLDTMRAMLMPPCSAARRPIGARLVQVAGSKGKGTAAAWLESWGRLAGQRVGVYASPHVSTIRERVRIDGALVAGDVLLDELDRVLAAVDAAGLAPSAFEILTATALRCFEREGPLDLVVLEVGLGGRLDATTAVDPVDALILTSIELEHVELLGDTTAKIAGEKAGVLRAPAGFAVSTVRDEIARGVLREAAARAGVEWLEAGDASAPGSDPHGRRGDAVLTRAERGSASAPLVEAEVHLGARSWPLRLPASVPAFHDPAIAASFAVWSRLFPEAPDRVPQPFTPEPPSLPGRAELLLDPVDGGTWLLDGAHTPASFRALAEEYARRFPGERCGLVFATASDKCWQSGLSALLPIVDDLCVPRMPGTRWANPEAIALQARRLGSTRTEVSNDLRSAIAALRARAPRGRRLVCGSFYLVGDVRDELLSPTPR
jgi:folylpolyglutamate synthase/dihydropteroate synthase